MSEQFWPDLVSNLEDAAAGCGSEIEDATITAADLALATAKADAAQEAYEKAHVDVFGSASPHADWYDHLGLEDMGAASLFGAAIIAACASGPVGCGAGSFTAVGLLVRHRLAQQEALEKAESELNIANLALTSAELKHSRASRSAMRCMWHGLFKGGSEFRSPGQGDLEIEILDEDDTDDEIEILDEEDEIEILDEDDPDDEIEIVDEDDEIEILDDDEPDDEIEILDEDEERT